MNHCFKCNISFRKHYSHIFLFKVIIFFISNLNQNKTLDRSPARTPRKHILNECLRSLGFFFRFLTSVHQFYCEGDRIICIKYKYLKTPGLSEYCSQFQHILKETKTMFTFKNGMDISVKQFRKRLVSRAYIKLSLSKRENGRRT